MNQICWCMLVILGLAWWRWGFKASLLLSVTFHVAVLRCSEQSASQEGSFGLTVQGHGLRADGSRLLAILYQSGRRQGCVIVFSFPGRLGPQHGERCHPHLRGLFSLQLTEPRNSLTDTNQKAVPVIPDPVKLNTGIDHCTLGCTKSLRLTWAAQERKKVVKRKKKSKSYQKSVRICVHLHNHLLITYQFVFSFPFADIRKWLP